MRLAVVLDTSFLIGLARQQRNCIELWTRLADEHHAFIVPAPAAIEFLAGFSDAAKALERLEQSSEIAPLDRAAAIEGAAIAREAFAKGRFPGWSDVFIAGIAKAHGDLAVVTLNPDDFPFTPTRHP